MAMWLKHSMLALLTAAMVILSQEHVILDETQRREKVFVGSSLTLQCRLKMPKNGRFWVDWYFNPSKASFNHSDQINQTVCNASEKTYTETTKEDLREEEWVLEETYIISNATQKNSGWYFCKITVEIPVLITKNSSGTEVTMKNLTEKTTNPSLVTSKQVTVSEHPLVTDLWMWILLGVSTFILVMLLGIFVLLRRRWHRHREPDPIYANTHPVPIKHPSPRPRSRADNNLKAGSSFQNLRTPSPGRRYEGGKQRHKV